MNRKTESEMEKQGWIRRLVTAVFRNLFAGLCLYDVNMSPYEAQMFMHYSGWWEVEEAMMTESLARMKLDKEV